MPRPARTPDGAKPSGSSSGTRLPEPGASQVLYLIDLSGYVFRAYHALPPLSSPSGEPTHAVLGTVNMLQKVVGERRPHMLAVAMDSPGPTFRHALDARYKATRPAPPPDLSQQMSRVEQIVRAWDVACFGQDTLEADDLIAAVTHRALDEGWRVVIVSADKDLMQLVRDDDDRVVLWDSMRDRVYGPNEVREKLGVAPSRVRDFLALTGDTSDNVPGVPGVGPKTAADLLAQFGSLDGIYASIDQVARLKLRESLREHEGDARMSRTLVTLAAEAPIEWQHAKLLWGGADVAELRRLYTELGFNRQIDQLDALADAAREPATAKREGEGLAGPSASPSESPPSGTGRFYDCVLDVGALDRHAEEARQRGQVGLAVQATSDDAVRAELIGLSLATQPGHGHYVPLSHRYLGCPPQLPWERVRAAVGPLLADARVAKVGHDLKRTAILLARAGAALDGPLFDTMIAAYLLDPEAPHGLPELARRELGVAVARHDDAVGKARAPHLAFDEVDLDRAAAFAAVDAEIALGLRSRFEPRLAAEGLDRLMRDVEMPLTRVLAAMETHGVLVDIPTLERLGREVERELRDLEADCKRSAGRDFSLRSRDQLEKILFDELKLPSVKRTPKGGRSTDADVLEALADRHELPARILAYRELDKLKGTYIDALPKCVNPVTGRIHTRFDQAVAATGRLSSSDPNLQNIPIRTELGRAIRAAFVAPPGQLILSADYSQIELRVLAHLAQDPELIDAFATGADVHARTAALMFDKAQDQVTADERRAAKTINFGVIYGMGDSALAKQLGIPREQAARFIAAYFGRYAGVARFMEKTVESARQGEAVRSLLGRRRFLPNLHSANRALRFEAERIARNMPIQGTAADILKLAMVEVGKEGALGSARMVLTVHDELVFEVPEGDAKAAGERIRESMQNAMKLSVPLVVDVGSAKNWAEAH
ncbi:MAG TPA: DNA polymerase I [Polyangiaceae bacterium]|nr:DNA polymerase I [Polyangiaceae bacterium]